MSVVGSFATLLAPGLAKLLTPMSYPMSEYTELIKPVITQFLVDEFCAMGVVNWDVRIEYRHDHDATSVQIRVGKKIVSGMITQDMIEYSHLDVFSTIKLFLRDLINKDKPKKFNPFVEFPLKPHLVYVGADLMVEADWLSDEGYKNVTPWDPTKTVDFAVTQEMIDDDVYGVTMYPGKIHAVDDPGAIDIIPAKPVTATEIIAASQDKLLKGKFFGYMILDDLNSSHPELSVEAFEKWMLKFEEMMANQKAKATIDHLYLTHPKSWFILP